MKESNQNAGWFLIAEDKQDNGVGSSNIISLYLIVGQKEKNCLCLWCLLSIQNMVFSILVLFGIAQMSISLCIKFSTKLEAF